MRNRWTEAADGRATRRDPTTDAHFSGLIPEYWPSPELDSYCAASEFVALNRLRSARLTEFLPRGCCLTPAQCPACARSRALIARTAARSGVRCAAQAGSHRGPMRGGAHRRRIANVLWRKPAWLSRTVSLNETQGRVRRRRRWTTPREIQERKDSPGRGTRIRVRHRPGPLGLLDL